MTQEAAALQTGLTARYVAPLNPACNLNHIGDGHRCQLGRITRASGIVYQRDATTGKPVEFPWSDDIFHLIGYGPSFAAAVDMAEQAIATN